MPLLYNHPRVPQNGFEFTDPSGVTIRDKSLTELILAIQKHRLINGLPKGEPETEVESLYAKKYPWLVSKYQPDHQKPFKPTETPKEAIFSEWLSGLWKTPIKESEWATDEVTESRLETCKNCEYNQKLQEKLNPKVELETKRRLMILSRGKIHSLFPSCSLHKWHCGMAAMLRDPKTDKEFDGCWVKKN